MNFKLIGGILLIIGVSVGAGILALPIVTATGGFYWTMGLFLLCWLGMTAGAFLVLEVNLALPYGSNLISMARATLGLKGQVMAWVSCLLLLYALLSAYIAGGADVISGFLDAVNIRLPAWVCAFMFTVVAGYVVFRGIRCVDYVNRGLMLIKSLLYVTLLGALSFFAGSHPLPYGSPLALLPSSTVVLTSFGYAVVIPSLRSYFDSNIALLRKAVIIGSAIPLFLYIAWILIIQSLLPITGENSLGLLALQGAPITGLSQALVAITQSRTVAVVIHAFVIVCIFTAFLGVALSLSDFLADGLSVKKEGSQGAMIMLLTFAPPLFILIIKPAMFIGALAYAGIFCVILLMLLPILMAWSARYRKSMIILPLIPGGRPVLALLCTLSLCFLSAGIYVSL